MALYVISDTHIKSEKDPFYVSFLEWIEETIKPDDVFVLAGDIFDLFIGTKTFFNKTYWQFFDILEKKINEGSVVYYIEGNHDFYFSRKKFKNINIYTEKLCLELSGKKFFISHGDTANQKDYSYQILRFFLRTFPVKFLLYLLPGQFVHTIGEKWSQLSRKRNTLQGEFIPVSKVENLRKIYRNFAVDKLLSGYDFVIMGHCHDNDEIEFCIEDRLGQYINVGYPKIHSKYLFWQEGQKKILRKDLNF